MVTDAATLSPAAIDDAAGRIAPAVQVSPLQISQRLSDRFGGRVYLKREDQQAVRSYKIRGAYNVMAQLSAEELSRGVVAASAGNHAQGVAYAARTMGVAARIYVPTNTPKQKCDRIRWHGGDFVELIAIGETYDAAAAAALEDVARTGAAWIHPFDDPRTAAGQGTIAREILSQLPTPPDLVVVPIGGGGCIAGIATYLSEHSPSTRLVGVEPTGAVSMSAALVEGGPVTLGEIDSFVDGAAVRRIGELGYRVLAARQASVAAHPDLPSGSTVRPGEVLQPGQTQVLHVDEGAICSEMLDLYQDDGIVAEPAGTLAITALEHIHIDPEWTVVCLVSGGNNDVSRYGEIIERSLVHRGLKHYFLVNFPQEPGALRRFLDDVLGPDDDITLFEYVKRNNRETGAALVGIELGTPAGLSPLLARMDASRLSCDRLEPGSAAYRYLT